MALRPRVVIFQPALPAYRIGLFDRMHKALGAGFQVFASAASIDDPDALARPWARKLAPTTKLPIGIEWQPGALNVRLQRGDVVVVSGAPRCLTNILLLIKARAVGARTIWWGHYWSSTSRPWRARLRLMIAQLSDALMFYTEREVETYRRRYGVRDDKPVFALNNGIETDEIARLRTPYDAVARGRNILFIGRLTEKSEFPLLLHALAAPICGGVTLHVIGEGVEGAKARSLASVLGLESRIQWHGALLDETRIAQIANRCALLVYPGSVGLSLIHGLAYGLPAIVHDDPLRHMPEFAALEQGRNGALFRRRDARSLAQVIATALRDTDQLMMMSANAVATTTDTYNARDMAERFCAAIEEVRHRAQ